MKCLVCYTETEHGADYHVKCSMKLFGSKDPPLVHFCSDDIHRLAVNIVLSQSTISGVQKKLSAHIQKIASEGSRMTLVGLWGDYILKPSSEEFPLLPVVEDCTMNVTETFGIEVMKHGLIKLASGELAYITKRHDREKSLPVYHMEDGCQLTETLTEYKYRSSMEKLGKCIRTIATNSQLDLIKYYEMVVVSFLTGNADMHLKNFSVSYRDRNKVALTPAYDMVSTRLLIPEQSDNEELALSLNGKKRKLTLHDFIAAGMTCGLSEKQVTNTIKRLMKKLPLAVSVIEKSYLPQKMKTDFIGILTERSQRLQLSTKN